MQVRSFGPVRTGSLVWQTRGGSFMLTVVCKTTYWLKPGEAQILTEQEAINEADDHWDDDPNRSVRAPSDLMPTKPRPEVTLVGYAYAPNGQPVRSLMARLVVGEVDKSIEVHCDRTFLSDGTLQEGPRFTRMRLTWERAGGGPGTNNPVGLRVDARDAYGRRPVPNLQPIGMHVSSIDDYVQPAGFGPIAQSWPSRAELLARAPSAAGEGLEGPSAAYYNAAPPDQLLNALRESERIVLENLHPEHARLVTNLPGLRPAIFVDRARGQGQRISPRADALWIDTDRSVATLTWRALVPLAHKDEPGRVLVGMEAAGHELTWAEMLQLMAGDKAEDEDGEDSPIATVTNATLRPGPALPFSAPGAELPFQPPRPASPPLKPPSPLTRPSWSMPAQAPPASVKPPAVPASVAPAAPGVPLPGTVISPVLGAPPAPVPPAPVPPAPVPPVPVPPAPVAPRPGASPSRPPPVVLSAARSVTPTGPASPWAAGGAPGAAAPARETLGTQAAAAAAAAAAVETTKDSAADGGALGASNEAAGIRPWSAPRKELRTVVGGEEEAADKPAISRELLHLVWFEPSFVPRIRRVAAWKKLLSELEQRGPDKGIDDVLAGKETWEIEDRREIFEILARGERADERGLLHMMDEAIREDGKYATPIVAVGGEIETPFDELEVLRALSTAAAPLVGPADEGLKAAVEAADKFLGRTGLSWAPTLPEGLSARIRETFVREKKSMPPESLDLQAERALVGGRHYQKREVLGGTYLRLLLRISSEGQPLVAYAPEAAAKKLPMFRKFRARLIAELHPSQDQYESRHESLRVLALGTVSHPDRGTAGAKG